MQLYTILAATPLASRDSVFKGIRMWQISNLKPLIGLNLKLKKPKNIPEPMYPRRKLHNLHEPFFLNFCKTVCVTSVQNVQKYLKKKF